MCPRDETQAISLGRVFSWQPTSSQAFRNFVITTVASLRCLTDCGFLCIDSCSFFCLLSLLLLLFFFLADIGERSCSCILHAVFTVSLPVMFFCILLCLPCYWGWMLSWMLAGFMSLVYMYSPVFYFGHRITVAQTGPELTLAHAEQLWSGLAPVQTLKACLTRGQSKSGLAS